MSDDEESEDIREIIPNLFVQLFDSMPMELDENEDFYGLV